MTGKLQGDPALHAPRILSDWLGRMFRKSIPVVQEEGFKGTTTAIYLGDTAYARSLKLDASSLDAEEYAILSDGKNVVITGGYPRGILFGAYDFLETYAGCTKLTVTEDYIPNTDRFSVPDNQLRRRQPYFFIREIRPTCYARADFEFYSWHRMNNRAHLDEKNYREYQRTPDAGPGHSLFDYGETFPKDSLEYFSMNAQGRRQRATSIIGPGQLCFSNKEVRRLVKEEIARRIAADEKLCREQGGEPRTIYNLGHNDNHSYCLCPECKALMAKYGDTFSGALLDFVNDIAAAFPDKMIQTFAYQISEKPPKNIKARDNVIIQFAVQCVLNVSGDCDPTRPLEHPFNKGVLDNIQQWRKVARHFAFWHYGRIFAQAFTTPLTLQPALSANFRLLKRLGVNSILSETHIQDSSVKPLALYDLQLYLTLKLIDDPDLDEAKLVSTFLDRYYGAAAPMMAAYRKLLFKAQKSEPTPICEVSAANRKYLNESFFRRAYSLVDKACEAVRGNAVLLARVEQEYYPLDCAVVQKWSSWKGAAAPFGLSREQTIDRIERVGNVILLKYVSGENRPQLGRSLEKYREAERNLLAKLRHPIPVPPQFAGQDIRQFSMLDNGYEVCDDADALLGKASKFPQGTVSAEEDAKLHGRPLEFGVYDYRIKKCILQKRFEEGELASDEKYHLYYMGRTVLDPTFAVFLHWTWMLRLHRTAQEVFNPADADREYDIYVSIKVTGPAYVKGSTSANAVYMDRVIYVPKGIRKMR